MSQKVFIEDLAVVIFFLVIMVPTIFFALKARKRRADYFRQITSEEKGHE